MLNFEQFITAKVSTLEYLIQHLFYSAFAKAPDPIQVARNYAEDMRARLEQSAQGTGDQTAAIVLVEHVDAFFESLIRTMQNMKPDRPPQ